MLCVMPLVLDAKDRDKVGWDKENKGFTFGNKPLSEQKLYRIARSEVERNENKFEKLTTKFVNGNISFEDWQRGMVDETRKAHVNMARLGRGGKENTYANNYLQVGNDLRKTHYPAFRNFAQDVADGKLTEKEIIARSRLYGSATKNSFEKARVSHYEDKPVIARRRLGGCKNHCPECIAYAMRGWGNLKDMIMPGEQCTCRMRCCCSIEIKFTEKKK
jgi:hypothetical protein